MTHEVGRQHHQPFDSIRHVDEDGREYWLARELARVLDYSEFRHFVPVVDRAMEACRNSGHAPKDHFEDILEMVEIGSGAKRQIRDIRLSRYACYLVVQNGDPSKPVSRAMPFSTSTSGWSATTSFRRSPRVNRLHEQKKYGLLIDYRGILRALDTAISKYQNLANRTQGGYGNRSAHYSLTETARLTSRILIHVHPGGEIEIEAPPDGNPSLIRVAIQKRARWIFDNLDAAKEACAYATPREYVGGETHFYLGRRYRLEVRQVRNESAVKLVGGALRVTTPVAGRATFGRHVTASTMS